MRGLFSKVSDPLKVRHTLDCTAADTNYLNKMYIFMYRIKIVICQLQNAKSNFPKFCKVHAPQKTKYKSGIFIEHLVETFALILHSKIVFKKLFLLKLSILRNTLNSLIPSDNKRSHILKNKPTPFSCKFV